MRAHRRIAVAILPMILVSIALVGIAQAPPALASGKLAYYQQTVTQQSPFSAGVESEDLTTNLSCPANDIAVEGGAKTTSADALMIKDEPYTLAADGTPVGLFAHGQTQGVIDWRGWSVTITDLSNGPLTYTIY